MNSSYPPSGKRQKLRLLIIVAILVSAHVVGLIAQHCIPTTEWASAAMLDDQLPDIPVLSTVKQFPELTRNAISFLWTPREFTARWARAQSRMSGWAVLALCLAVVSLLYGVYSIVFKTTPLGRLFPSRQSKSEPAQKTVKPRFIGIGIKTRAGFQGAGGSVRSETSFNWSPLPSLEFPEALQKGLQEPQLLRFKAGIINILVANVRPADFATKTAQTFFLVLYALIGTLCFFPAAHILGSRANMAEAFDFTLTAFSYCMLWLAALLLGAVLLVVNILRVNFMDKLTAINSRREFAVFFLVATIWNALAFVPPGRSAYVACQVVYGLNNAKMWGAAGLSFIFSAFVGPVVLIPAFYVWLKGREVIEKVA